jgi:hypothetical protein
VKCLGGRSRVGIAEHELRPLRPDPDPDVAEHHRLGFPRGAPRPEVVVDEFLELLVLAERTDLLQPGTPAVAAATADSAFVSRRVREALATFVAVAKCSAHRLPPPDLGDQQ